MYFLQSFWQTRPPSGCCLRELWAHWPVSVSWPTPDVPSNHWVDHYSCFPPKAHSCFPEMQYLVPQGKRKFCRGVLAHCEFNFSTLHQSYILNLNLVHAEWNRTLEVYRAGTQSSYTSQWLLNKPVSLLMSLLNELLSPTVRWLKKICFFLNCNAGRDWGRQAADKHH